MGRVWKARDEVLHRDVAIKELVPPPGLTDDERREMRERSLREARAIARLNHANVVRVFDVLRTDGDPWIVMEYIPSRSLQDVLANDGPVPPARAAEIGLGVLGALRAAHRAGVMHRDIKPGNVLLGHDGRVVLTDFGLATVPGDPNVTRTGLVLGSPAYIAPERARDGTAGPEADLWSLGATLYAAVEGQSPYARPSAIGTLAALATEPLPPPKNAGALKPVLVGLLRKDPTQRITAETAERLLRKATGRTRGAMSLLDGVRRPGPNGPREARGTLVPQPRPAEERPPAPPVTPPAAPEPTPADPTEAATRVDVGGPVPETSAPAGAGGAEPTAKVPTPAPRDAGASSEDRQSGSTARPAASGSGTAEPPTQLLSGSQKPAEPTQLVPGPGRTAEERKAEPPAAAASAPVLGPPATVARGDRENPVGAALAGLPGPRRNWIIGAVVVLILLALVIIVPLATRDSGNNTGAQTGTDNSPSASSPSAAPTSAPAPPPPTSAAPTVTASATPSGPGEPVIPAGWKLYRDPQEGFSVPVPDGWRVERRNDGNIYFRGGDGRWFLVGWTDSPKSDALADWRDQERRRKGDYPGYELVAMRRVDYWNEAADWEWRQNRDGVRVHTINRGFVTGPKHGYAIRWETPESVWQQNLPNFQVIVDGFRPASN